MDMMILAELTSKWAFSGVFCLAAIPCIIIVILAYSAGPWAGSCTCLAISVIVAFATYDNSPGQSGGGVSIDGVDMFVTNSSQTKWLSQGDMWLDEPGSIFFIHKDVSYFIPAKELYEDSNGTLRLKTTGEKATWGDYYIVDDPVDRANVAKSDGGWGIPQWVYHPGAPIWIFGIAGAPALLGGVLIAGKLKG